MEQKLKVSMDSLVITVRKASDHHSPPGVQQALPLLSHTLWLVPLPSTLPLVNHLTTVIHCAPCGICHTVPAAYICVYIALYTATMSYALHMDYIWYDVL